MSHLVAMTKNGETLGIHPDLVGAHEALGWAVGGELKAEKAGPSVKDAHQDDKSGDDAAKVELASARADYEAKLGKKPFMGWDAKTLREKIAAA